jgi:hypothetical protein
MKLLLAFIIAIVLTACAKEKATNSTTNSSVEDVANAFTAGFGSVTVTEWKLTSDGTYAAHFTNNGVLWEATYKADGTLVKSEPA